MKSATAKVRKITPGAPLDQSGPKSSERRIEYLPLASIQGATRNPKLHALGDLGTSISGHGFVEVPTLDERTGRLVAGHGRIEALKARHAAGEPPPGGVRGDVGGEWLVPILRGWGSRDDADAENYLVASNQLTIAAGWEKGGLTDIIRDLAKADSLEGLGFNATELELLLTAPTGIAPVDPDDVPDLPGKSWVEPGMMFQLGRHRLIYGDSTSADVAARLMAEELAEMCWTDPPWNIAYDGKESRGRRQKKTLADGTMVTRSSKTRPERPIINDNLGEDFPQFCALFCGEIARVMAPGAPLYMAMATSELGTIHHALTEMGFHWSSTIIWAKDVFSVGRKDYHTQYEPIWYGWKDGAARLHPMRDRKQSDVWSIPRPKRSDAHPTMKPVELVARALRNSSKHQAIVFEPFSGSGSTLIACEVTGRRCRAIELDPGYVQVAIERWERFTGRRHEKL